jgi:hypothetical protein
LAFAKKANTKEYLLQSGLDCKLLFLDNGIILNNDRTKHEQFLKFNFAHNFFFFFLSFGQT